MAMTDDRGSYSFGSGLYNLVINAYVPGQIVGFEFKRNLLIGTSSSQLALDEGGFEAITGTTPTGFADVYRDFWFFGAGVFFLTALLMGDVFRRPIWFTLLEILVKSRK